VIDLHVHTALCRHAEGMPVDYVRHAARVGVTTIAFTDHLPLPPLLADRIPGAAGYAMRAEELDRYVTAVVDAQELGADLGIEVLLGAEADAVPEAVAHARELISGRAFDVVLASVHFIDDWAFDDPARTERYGQWDIRALWERYFEDLVAAARAGIGDVVAHADLVKKFCFVPEGELDALYREVADAIGESGAAVEVNTAGLRKPCRELYPAPGFLRALRASGVPVTIGSDAHAPEQVGSGWNEALAALTDAGYESCLIFRQRVAEEVGLADA
jgi:histidinol-phosphatase (PHP family)